MHFVFAEVDKVGVFVGVVVVVVAVGAVMAVAGVVVAVAAVLAGIVVLQELCWESWSW